MVPNLLIDEADRKRREMVAAAIHELRHPVTVQGITLDLLRAYAATNLSPDAAAMIQRMARATAYLMACIDELQNRMLFDLDFMTIRPQLINVRASIEAVVWQHEPLLLRRRQHVGLRMAHDLQAWADPIALGHVLANLLVNAHKHSTVGDTVEISARRLARLQQVEIRVRDHGPGVPAQERRRIFDRFYRGERARSQRGAGLGLTIVKSLVEQQGGDVGVDAARGGGALFWVRLPAAAPPQTAELA
jgi:two-component system sensor histidine kinase MprB